MFRPTMLGLALALAASLASMHVIAKPQMSVPPRLRPRGGKGRTAHHGKGTPRAKKAAHHTHRAARMRRRRARLNRRGQ